MTARTWLYFPGCKINTFMPQYGLSTRSVMTALGISLDQTELNCCGYPVRHENFAAFMVAAVRNLAIAAARGLALMTPCKCCFGNLKHADHWMHQDETLRRQINALLAKEGLAWRQGIVIRHLLSVLDEAVGTDALKTAVTRPLTGLRVAAHYGCHALRPGNITQFDNPLAPTLFERMVALTGATAVNWPLRLECCGQPQTGKNNRVAMALMTRKLDDARQADAQIMATACTHCQMQFDDGQFEYGPPTGCAPVPAVLYTQLLGTAMGLPEEALGLEKNRIPWRF